MSADIKFDQLLDAILSVPAVLAQTAPQGKGAAAEPLEEITVTARRREESLQDVPIAVTAFSGEDLALVGTSDIGELAQAVPNVTFEPTRATSSTLTAFIRGVGHQDPLAGFEQGVALFVDDVYTARPQGSLLDIYDVERIEILRGPQGTLYGRNAVGGAIKYVTRHLSDDLDFRAKASYGSYNQIDLV